MPKFKAKTETSLSTRSSHKHPSRKQVVAAAQPTKMLQVNVPAPLHKSLKILAVQKECTLTDIVVRLITDYMDAHEQGKIGSK